MVSGILLAAGLSQRMGTPKQLLPYRDTTLLGHAIDTAARSMLTELIVVLSTPCAGVEELTGYVGVTPVLNPAPQRGMSSSLRLGIAHLSPSATGALVLMCDQPGVSVELIDTLISTFEGNPTGALVPTYDGIRSSPVLLGRSFLALASTLPGDTGARTLLSRLSEHVRTVEVGRLGRNADIDTPEEYARLQLREATRP